MSSFAPVFPMRAAVSSELSASTLAVAMVLPVRCFTEAAMSSHFERVREARVISPKVSASMAHLWATTLPTPPAPMMRTLCMGKVFGRLGRLGKFFSLRNASTITSGGTLKPSN